MVEKHQFQQLRKKETFRKRNSFFFFFVSSKVQSQLRVLSPGTSTVEDCGYCFRHKRVRVIGKVVTHSQKKLGVRRPAQLQVFIGGDGGQKKNKAKSNNKNPEISGRHPILDMSASRFTVQLGRQNVVQILDMGS